MSDEFDPPSWTDKGGVWHSGTRAAHDAQTRRSAHGSEYPWHVDDNGNFQWGTPLDRARIIAEGNAPAPPPEMTREQEPAPEPSPERGRER